MLASELLGRLASELLIRQQDVVEIPIDTDGIVSEVVQPCPLVPRRIDEQRNQFANRNRHGFRLGRTRDPVEFTLATDPRSVGVERLDLRLRHQRRSSWEAVVDRQTVRPQSLYRP